MFVNHTDAVRQKAPDGHRAAGKSVADLARIDRRLEIAIKYGLDRFLGLLALVALAPFIAVTAVLLGVCGGRAFRFDPSIGENGRAIRLCRFARARKHRRLGVRISIFLRWSGLENVPLLINVVRGELSLVGPPPHRVYQPGDPVHTMRPGLYLPGPRRSGPEMAERSHHRAAQRTIARDYVENFSLARDLAIVWAALRRGDDAL